MLICYMPSDETKRALVIVNSKFFPPEYLIEFALKSQRKSEHKSQRLSPEDLIEFTAFTALTLILSCMCLLFVGWRIQLRSP